MVKRMVVVILLLMVSLFPLPRFSSAFSRTDSLQGLEGIEILVEEFKPEVEDFISVIQVQIDVETKLRQAGIRILDKEENEKIHPLRKPYLYIKITSYKPPTRRDVLAFNAEISLKQQVSLRGPEFAEKWFFSPTWYKNSVGVATLRNSCEIKNVIEELTENFIKAYLKAKGAK